MVTHGNTSHFLKNSSIYFKPNRKSRFAHIAEIVFDPSIFDLFVCWKNAGTVVPFNKNEYKIDNNNVFKLATQRNFFRGSNIGVHSHFHAG